MCPRVPNITPAQALPSSDTVAAQQHSPQQNQVEHNSTITHPQAQSQHATILEEQHSVIEESHDTNGHDEDLCFQAHEEHLSTISSNSMETISHCDWYEPMRVSFQPLLASSLILYHIIKFLDLHSNLAVSLTTTQLYLVASSDRIWARYIVKSAKRGRSNWHIAWGGEPCWWMQRGERIIRTSKRRQPILSNDHDTMRILNSVPSTDILTEDDQPNGYEENSSDYEEVIQKNELIHGYADFVPCLSDQSGISGMISSVSQGLVSSLHESRQGLSRSMWDAVTKVVPSVVLPCSPHLDSNTPPHTEHTPPTPSMPSGEKIATKRLQSTTPGSLSKDGHGMDLQEFRRLEYTPELTLQYWREDFAPESSLPGPLMHASSPNGLISLTSPQDIELRDASSIKQVSHNTPLIPSISQLKNTNQVSLPQIPGHGVKQSYALFKKTLRYEVEFRKFQESMTKKGQEIDKVVRYRIKPCVWTTLVTYFFCVVFWTSITAPMLWDNVIPMDGLWWLIPFAGFGMFVPLFLIVLVLEVFFTGWIPCISFFLKHYFQQSCQKLHALLQSSQIALIHYMSYWFDPWHARDIESRILSIISMHLLYVPTLILCLGVNQLFFVHQKVMSIVVIPTYICFLGSFLDFARRLFFGRKGRFCHVKLVHTLLLINLSLVYLGIVLTIGLAASKRDAHAWMQEHSWTIVSIPLAFSMGFLILNISFFRFYMIIRDAKYRYHQCMDWLREAFYMVLIFLVTSLMFFGFIATVVLLPLKMDGTLDVPFLVAVSPIPLSIAVVTALLIAMVVCACSISFVSQLFKRGGDAETV
uniref:F-box domain-containing protein n=1 Tax=Percolomonas cosmopolitus TaxID=63605 RepID=A0A7S1PHZ3_9EUKA|mmetsp:Transcript_2967/g.11343  ORF Transcript_2967/g.11343 Transcript_2967/m.11343 type:complete len:813 (+) Transcript_2967:248-2686(+)|eukprot:CAMPEP_0117439776 /NCGR_PEP_ID=MMETSP0759-20121206/2737_1 /TAXON_ID=63605 /ORGANISM="Percolomonas cosmopolitus, Strain WS" /LENGTH=812 /DNA_ID=CAMNT_0005231497 /DNA_START=389 /DNA_END=2827 /DNA_ORIENTATION=-